MTDEYKRFIRHLRAATVGLTFEQIAEALNVCTKSARDYYNLKAEMKGGTMLKAIRLMGGYKC